MNRVRNTGNGEIRYCIRKNNSLRLCASISTSRIRMIISFNLYNDLLLGIAHWGNVLGLLSMIGISLCCLGTDDSHRTVMQVMYTPHVIAAAAFYFARKFTHTEVHTGDEGKEWWEQYGVKIDQLRDAVLMMVEIYNTLPHLNYQGKYPSSAVSPPDHHKERLHENGTTSEDVEMKDAAPNTPAETTQLRTEPKETPSTQPIMSPKVRPSVSSSPKSTRITSPPPRERGRSPARAPRGRDVYRPNERSRSRGGHASRSNSRSARRVPRGVDRYVPPASSRERDSYIPPRRSPRKRPNDENSPVRGREKRKRSPEEEMSEGEIR